MEGLKFKAAGFRVLRLGAFRDSRPITTQAPDLSTLHCAAGGFRGLGF